MDTTKQKSTFPATAPSAFDLPEDLNDKDDGWAWKPDSSVNRAIAKGNRRLARHKRQFDKSFTEVKTMAQRKGTKAAKKTTTKPAAKKAPASNVVSLKELLRDTDLDARLARRKLRAAGLKGHDPKARWEFSKAQVPAAKKALGI